MNLNGVLEASEVQETCNINVVKVGLLADTDRNGIINDLDEAGKTNWTIVRGAFVPPANIDYHDGILNPVSNLSKIIVAAVPSLPVGCKLRFRRSNGTQGQPALLAADGSRLFGAGGGLEYGDIPGPYTTNQVFYVSSERCRHVQSSSTNPIIYSDNLYLEAINTASNVVCSDVVLLKTAPLIQPWDGAPVEKIYVSDACFPTNTTIPNLVRLASAQSVFPWAQDYVKLCKVQTSASLIQDVAVDLRDNDGGNFLAALTNKTPQVHVTDFIDPVLAGNGGNYQVTPPLPSAPYGKIITGTSKTNFYSSYYRSQGLQTNAIVLPCDWLVVGHVDEVVAFIDTSTVIVPDPWTAANIMHTAITNGTGTNTIWFGPEVLASSDTTQTFLNVAVATNPLMQFKTNSLPMPGLAATTTNVTLTFLGQMFGTGDYVRVENEILAVVNVVGQTVTFARQQGGTLATSHSAGTFIYALSDQMRYNLPIASTNATKYLADVTNQLVTQLAPYQINIIKVPVLFVRGYREIQPTVIRFVADSANVVNCLNVPGSGIYVRSR